MCRLLFLYASILLTCAFLDTPRGYCQLPAEVIEALVANSQEIDGMQISWGFRRTSELPMPVLAKTLMLMPHYAKSTMFFDEEAANSAIDDGRILARFSFREPILKFPPVDEANPQVPDLADILITGSFEKVIELSFDGTHFFSGIAENGAQPAALLVYHRDHAIDNAIQQGMSEEVCDLRWRHNYWREAGFDVPTNEYDYVNPRVTSSVLHAAAISGARVESESARLSERETLKVTISVGRRIQIFHLDPSLQYAAVRREDYDEEARPVSTTTANDFQLVPSSDRVYLPREIEVTHYQWNNLPPAPSARALFQSHYSLKSAEKKKLSVADFQLNYNDKSGTHIGDDRLPTAETRAHGLVNYVVPADARNLDAAVRQAIDETPVAPTPLRESTSNNYVLFGANAIVITVLVIAIWFVRIWK